MRLVALLGLLAALAIVTAGAGALCFFRPEVGQIKKSDRLVIDRDGVLHGR